MYGLSFAGTKWNFEWEECKWSKGYCAEAAEDVS